MEDAGGGLPQDGVPFRLGERRLVDDPRRLGIADREGIIGAEHDSVRTGDVTKKAQRLRLEQHRIEIEAAKAVKRVRIAVGMDRAVAAQPAERVGQRAATMRPPG